MIIQHPSHASDNDSCMVVECDKCNTLASRTGKDNNEAASNAILFDNFCTVRGKKSTDPRRWLCPGCHKKNDYPNKKNAR